MELDGEAEGAQGSKYKTLRVRQEKKDGDPGSLERNCRLNLQP